MTGENRKYGGFLLIELITSLTVLGILLSCLAISLSGFRRFNHLQLVRQQCTAAAQAELDSIAATGRQISNEDFERLWPKVSVSIEYSEARGQWEGLKLVKVKAKGKSFNKNVEVQLSRYIVSETRQ